MILIRFRGPRGPNKTGSYNRRDRGGRLLLKEFIEEYYHLARPHQGLNGDTSVPSAKPEPAGDVSRLVSVPVIGGLHHRYMRLAA